MFNVLYDRADGSSTLYCAQNCDYDTAERMLALFKSRYLNVDGSSRTYPNGKGAYTCTNPRIVHIV